MLPGISYYSSIEVNGAAVNYKASGFLASVLVLFLKGTDTGITSA